MASKELSVLFSPIKIGPIQLKNRFMRSAVYMRNCNADGCPLPPLIDYYKELSKGDWGLVTMGAMYAQLSGKSLPCQGGLETEKQVESWRKTVEQMHENGSKVIFQIVDGGVGTEFELCREPPRGPSRCGEGTRQMTKYEIQEVIENFAKAARRVEKIGADGVQIHSAHGYLISEFLSKSSNFRDDEYGGSAENRRRLLQEVTNEIRRTVDTKKFLISTKINANDCLPDGNDCTDLADVVKNVKGIDLFEISCGFQDVRTTIRPKASHLQKEGYPLFQGYNMKGIKSARKVSKTAKLACVGGFHDTKTMINAINEGSDLISLGRPSIADPLAIKHLKEGKPLLCMSCSHCILGIGERPVECPLQ